MAPFYKIFFLSLFLQISFPFASYSTPKSSPPGWLTLLHYEKTSLGSWKSLSDDPKFFLASDGRFDPDSEMQANKEALQSDPTYLCRFPARYEWLKKTFSLNAPPPKDCPEFSEWRNAIGAQSVSLVFADAFLNNPASLFGHTFLRLNRGEKDVSLLDYAIHYAARTGPDPGPIYAMKGIFGGYSGFFSVAPYYTSVQKYVDTENRDLWEFPLPLSPEETNFLVSHVWELRSISFPYYYFDLNCSYQLLALLDMVRPDLQLIQKSLPWIIPSDTVKTVHRAGILGEPNFRPSLATKLQGFEKFLSSTERKEVQKLSKGKRSPSDPTLTSSNKISVLESAALLTEYAENTERSQQTLLNLYRARSALKNQTDPPLPPRKPSLLETHDSRQLGVGGGWNSTRGAFGQFQIRPAYHSLEDPSRGFTPGSGIELLKFDFRYYHEHEINLHAAQFLRVSSLSPRSDFLSPRSYELKVGRELQRFSAPGSSLTTQGGIGATFFLADPVYLASLIEARTEDDSHFGAGPVFQLGASISNNVDLTLRHEILFSDRPTSLAEASLRYILSKEWLLELQIRHEDPHGEKGLTTGLNARWYF